MNLDSTTSGSVWTIVYAIPGFSSQKDFFFAIKYFFNFGSGEGVSGEEARSHSLLLLTQWTPVGWARQEFKLVPSLPCESAYGVWNGSRGGEDDGGQFQAPAGTSWSTSFFSVFLWQGSPPLSDYLTNSCHTTPMTCPGNTGLSFVFLLKCFGPVLGSLLSDVLSPIL